MKPDEIEKLSFEIIDREVGHHRFTAEQWEIVRRMIHTSADFEYKDSVCFHRDAIEAGIKAIRAGKAIITDTRMALAGIRSRDLAIHSVAVKCFMDDPEVAKRAKINGTTRAKAAVDAAIAEMQAGIYVVGNAPTALLRLIELVQTGRARPALIIGLPVGFVNAGESKAALMKIDYPHISNQGRKGGSTVAASVVNALTDLATRTS
jgi:precorrin-8X/cobalt-precorrin-8 methylmutase